MTVNDKRHADLRRMLCERRREIQGGLSSRVRDGLAQRTSDARDELERSDARVQGDIDLAVLQVRAQMLTRITEALKRLDTGEYGSCCECAAAISSSRLQALPFAVRCHSCETNRERAHRQSQRSEERRDRISLFSDTTGI